MAIGIILGIAFAIILVVGSIFLLRRSEIDPLAARMDEYAAREEIASIEEIELSLGFSDRVLVPILRSISDLVVRYTPQSQIERTAQQLEQAGSPRNMSAATFWGIRIVITIVLGILGFFILFRNQEFGNRMLYTLIAFAVGFFLPQLLLKSMIDRRKDAIVKKFPDALDLMTICVDAGLTFDGAMAQVSQKWDDPLANEYGRVVSELQLGKTRRQALQDMRDRIDVSDVTSFIASILQADQLGVSIGKVLRIQSEQMRIRRRQRAEELAQQAPVKMTFPLVFLVFPSILLTLLGPAMFLVLRNEALGSVTG